MSIFGPPDSSMTVLLIIGSVAAGVAVILHLYIFVMESVLFSRPSTLRMFEVEPADAPAVRLWAFHQGVYNLLLALVTAAGIVGIGFGAVIWGAPVAFAGTVSMLVAAIALIAADRRRARVTGLFAQGGPALVAVVTLGAALSMGVAA
jgi:putative membrane protein